MDWTEEGEDLQAVYKWGCGRRDALCLHSEGLLEGRMMLLNYMTLEDGWHCGGGIGWC